MDPEFGFGRDLFEKKIAGREIVRRHALLNYWSALQSAQFISYSFSRPIQMPHLSITVSAIRNIAVLGGMPPLGIEERENTPG